MKGKKTRYASRFKVQAATFTLEKNSPPELRCHCGHLRENHQAMGDGRLYCVIGGKDCCNVAGPAGPRS